MYFIANVRPDNIPVFFVDTSQWYFFIGLSVLSQGRFL